MHAQNTCCAFPPAELSQILCGAQDADGGRSPGVETADDSSPDPVAPVVDDAAETKDSDDAASAGYLGMLRAALARVGQPAAAATVWAWLQVRRREDLSRPDETAQRMIVLLGTC